METIWIGCYFFLKQYLILFATFDTVSKSIYGANKFHILLLIKILNFILYLKTILRHYKIYVKYLVIAINPYLMSQKMNIFQTVIRNDGC